MTLAMMPPFAASMLLFLTKIFGRQISLRPRKGQLGGDTLRISVSRVDLMQKVFIAREEVWSRWRCPSQNGTRQGGRGSTDGWIRELVRELFAGGARGCRRSSSHGGTIG